MAIFRCKMCGGDLAVIEGESSCTCEFCGTRQTIPTVRDEGLQTLFNRANTLRLKSEFDKAAEIYERILQRSEGEAEAYWGLILCKYGIEYVEDPKTGRRIPTCHRASYDPVATDEDYKNALQYADVVQRGIFEAEAAEIDRIQKGILELAQKEDPYDVFICYKETDENGGRTQDSVIANDIYYQLTREGLKVFYAAITLEDKLGREYEPYIFSALNTAKVMLVIGTRPEYFRAVWVKNEWSRFLKIMKKDRTRLLIPCYRDMDPYELPEEFAHLQAQNMGKIGFIADLVRGIRKVVGRDAAPSPAVQERVVVQQVAVAGTSTAGTKITRGNIALEDHEWERADEFFEEALNLEPKCAEAYLGKLLAAKHLSGWAALVKDYSDRYSGGTAERLEACPADTAHIEEKVSEYYIPGYLPGDEIRRLYEFDRHYDSLLESQKQKKEKMLEEIANERLFVRAQRFAEGETADRLAELPALPDKLIDDARAEDRRNAARIKADYAAHLAEADKAAEALNAQARGRQEADYNKAVAAMQSAVSAAGYEDAKKALSDMKGYRDSAKLAEQCQNEIERLKNEQKKKEQTAAAKERARKGRRRFFVFVLLVAAAFGVYKYGIPELNLLREYGMETYKEIRAIHVGDVYTYGQYEQDGNTGNGKEPIEWIVLDRDGADLLLISRYVLDIQNFDSASGAETWEGSSLRTWMNVAFANSAFTPWDQGKLQKKTVSPDKNPKFLTSPGNETQDKVFLLSIDEAEKYFGSDKDRVCSLTAYAAERFSDMNEGSPFFWWLRTPGSGPTLAAYVSEGGSVDTAGFSQFDGTLGVRPALWLRIGS